MNSGKILIVCKIFADELRVVMPADNHVKILWIDAALHTDLPRLEDAIMHALEENSGPHHNIRVFFGGACLPEIDILLKQHEVTRAPVNSCIEAFLGPKVQELEKNNTMIMTPGWVRA